MAITANEVEKLSKLAVKLGPRSTLGAEPRPPGKTFTRTVTRTMELPFEEDVRVAIKSKQLTHGMEKRTVKAKKMVPVETWKEIEEETIEVREETVTEWVEEWKLVRTPVTRVVKVPVKVIKKRRVPVIEYVEQLVDIAVDVPVDKIEIVDGVRVDRVAKAKVLEVQEEERYEWRPMRVGVDRINVREVGNGAELGRTAGDATYPSAPQLNVHANPKARPRSAYRASAKNAACMPLDEGITIMENVRGGVTVAGIDKGCLGYKSGLRVGDLVERVEARPCPSERAFRSAMNEHKGVKGMVRLKVKRGRSTRHITLNKLYL